MDIDNLLPFRGFCALVIMMHHFSASAEPKYLLGIFTHIGYLFVAVFFFISGYGVTCGYQKNNSYISLKSFVPKRFMNTVLPYWLCVLFTAVLIMIFFPPLNGMDFIKSFVSPNGIVHNAWYVAAVLIMYAGFILIFKIKNTGIALAVMFIYVTGFIVAMLMLKESIWARSTFAFYLGIVYSFYKEKFDSFFKKNYFIKLSLFLIAFAGTCVLRYLFVLKNNFYAENIFAIAGSSLFAIIVFGFILKKVKVNNPILRFSGKISYEIYLMHGFFCSELYMLNKNILLYYLIIISCTFVSSFIIFKAHLAINHFLNRKRKNAE